MNKWHDGILAHLLDDERVVATAQTAVTGDASEEHLLHWADGAQGRVDILGGQLLVDTVQDLQQIHEISREGQRRENIIVSYNALVLCLEGHAHLDEGLREGASINNGVLGTADLGGSHQLHGIGDLLGVLDGVIAGLDLLQTSNDLEAGSAVPLDQCQLVIKSTNPPCNVRTRYTSALCFCLHFVAQVA